MKTGKQKSIIGTKTSPSLTKFSRVRKAMILNSMVRKSAQSTLTGKTALAKPVTKSLTIGKSGLMKPALKNTALATRPTSSQESYRAIARLVKESNLDTKKAISTLQKSPSAADKDFFAAIKRRMLSMK